MGSGTLDHTNGETRGSPSARPDSLIAARRHSRYLLACFGGEFLVCYMVTETHFLGN